MSKLKSEDKRLHEALNNAMKDGDFFDTILEAAQAKQIEQLQAKIKDLKEAIKAIVEEAVDFCGVQGFDNINAIAEQALKGEVNGKE